ncbi:uncharacterized protein [Rutidosis leptorrhynchoides]|uniref:uncharacterized protein n=1 Tax=Rutidosis leptorrhynchoides TaxID=125765 RepID=UPI003A98DA52
MEEFDDLIIDIPDTPDRCPARHGNGGEVVGKESKSLSGRFRNSGIIHEESLNHPREMNRMKTESGNIRRLFIRPPKSPVNNGEVEPRNLVSSPSTLFRKITMDKNSKDETRNMLGRHHMNKGKAIYDEKFSKKYGSVLKGKEKVDESACMHTDSATNNGNVADPSNDSQYGMEKQNIKSQNSLTPPRLSARKRLAPVRNGCISPQNIAIRAQQPAEHGQLAVEANGALQNQAISVSSNGPSSLDIREIVSNENFHGRFKGKGTLAHMSTAKEHDAEIIDLSSSNPMNKYKEAHGTGGGIRDSIACSQESGRWRHPHNRTRNIDCLSPDDTGNSRFAKRQKNGLALRNNEAIVDLGSNHSETALLDASGRSSGSSSTIIHNHHWVIPTPIVETVILDSPEYASGSSSSTIRNCQRRITPTPIVETAILDSSERSFGSSSSMILNHQRPVIPTPIVNSDTHVGRISTDESYARLRQLEADEAFGRVLQEQLYSEIDENIARSLQQQEDVHHAPSSGTCQSRTVSGTPSNRHPSLRSRQSSSNSRGNQARAPPRRTQLRSRIIGRPNSVAASRPRNVEFPPGMDLDVRLDILEALETAFGDVGPARHIVQVQRDFNENDYEMLLALDDNNHQHGGASASRINTLPESIVQMDNYEDCAVCLETPTVGETIRHLPCLHKFHKDCIDRWLSRKSTCPVCKSSIT